MDMDPHTPKAIWGFNGTERPGAVYLAAVLAAHAQKGLPAFGIYGHDVQDADATRNSRGRAGKDLALCHARAWPWPRCAARATFPWAMWRWASPVPSCNPDFFEKYLGMRCESGGHERVRPPLGRRHLRPRRVRARPCAWVKENVTLGWDKNPPKPCSTHAGVQAVEVLETCIKMTMIGRDLMIGNPQAWPRWASWRRAAGTTPSRRGFQGQRQWTDHFPNGDYDGVACSIPASTGTASASPSSSPRRTTRSTACAMLLGQPAHRHGQRLCRRAHLLEPRGRGARDRLEARGPGQGRLYPPDQFRRGDAGRHRRSAKSTASPP